LAFSSQLNNLTLNVISTHLPPLSSERKHSVNCRNAAYKLAYFPSTSKQKNSSHITK